MKVWQTHARLLPIVSALLASFLLLGFASQTTCFAESTAESGDDIGITVDGTAPSAEEEPGGIVLSSGSVFAVLILAAAAGTVIGISFARRPRKERREEEEDEGETKKW